MIGGKNGGRREEEELFFLEKKKKNRSDNSSDMASTMHLDADLSGCGSDRKEMDQWPSAFVLFPFYIWNESKSRKIRTQQYRITQRRPFCFLLLIWFDPEINESSNKVKMQLTLYLLIWQVKIDHRWRWRWWRMMMRSRNPINESISLVGQSTKQQPQPSAC